MREQFWCPNPKCNKKRWGEVTIIELTGKENKITTTCPKCGTVVTRIIGSEVPQKETSKDS